MFYAVLTKNANQRFAIICDNIQMRNRAKQKQLDSEIPPLAANTAKRHIPIAQLCPRRRAWGNHNDLTHHISGILAELGCTRTTLRDFDRVYSAIRPC